MAKNTAWANRVVVISGAASGIGEALARQLADQGASLMLCDIHEARLRQLHEALLARHAERAEQFRSQVLDVASLPGYMTLAEDVKAIWGRVDVVVNNAGVALMETVAQMKVDDAHWIMGINFWGVFNGCKAFIPLLRTSALGAGRDKPAPMIVNISSIFAMVSMPSQSMYNAAKAAVRGYSDALREELRADGVQVLCVHPGGIKTRIVEDARFGAARVLEMSPGQMKTQFQANAFTTADAAASKIIVAMEAGKTRLLIGKDAKILDILFRLAPASATRRFVSLAIRQRDKRQRDKRQSDEQKSAPGQG